MRLLLRGPLRVRAAIVVPVAAHFLLAGCASSGKAVVASYSAERIYQLDRYERRCVAEVGPLAGCQEMQTILQTLERTDKATGQKVGLIVVANQVQAVGGALPKQEQAELDKLFARLRVLP